MSLSNEAMAFASDSSALSFSISAVTTASPSPARISRTRPRPSTSTTAPSFSFNQSSWAANLLLMLIHCSSSTQSVSPNIGRTISARNFATLATQAGFTPSSSGRALPGAM